MELKGKKINFLGDSITEGCGTSGIEFGFPWLLKQRLGLAEARNYGIGGTRIAAQLACAGSGEDRNYCGRALELDPDADVVVVFGGTNDYGHGDAPLGGPEDRTENTFWGACHVLFARLQERFPKAAIVVLTPLHRANEENERGDSSKPVPSGTLETYVEILRAVVRRFDLPMLDLFEKSAVDTRIPGVVEKYIPDGLHPNDAGHVVLADEIEAFLRNL